MQIKDSVASIAAKVLRQRKALAEATPAQAATYRPRLDSMQLRRAYA